MAPLPRAWVLRRQGEDKGKDNESKENGGKDCLAVAQPRREESQSELAAGSVTRPDEGRTTVDTTRTPDLANKKNASTKGPSLKARIATAEENGEFIKETN